MIGDRRIDILQVHRVVACRTEDVLPVMYIGLGSCVSLCYTFAMVTNKFMIDVFNRLFSLILTV